MFVVVGVIMAYLAAQLVFYPLSLPVWRVAWLCNLQPGTGGSRGPVSMSPRGDMVDGIGPLDTARNSGISRPTDQSSGTRWPVSVVIKHRWCSRYHHNITVDYCTNSTGQHLPRCRSHRPIPRQPISPIPSVNVTRPSCGLCEPSNKACMIWAGPSLSPFQP